MTVATIKEAWAAADELFPGDYMLDQRRSGAAGYPVYSSTTKDRPYNYICDLGDRLEINLDNGTTTNIWITGDTQGTKKAAIRSGMDAIIAAHSANRDNGPAATITALVDGIGYRAAVAAVATLINSTGEWDGRISRSTREWANGINVAATESMLTAMHIYQPSAIHPAHIDQIGRAMIAYAKEVTKL